MHHPSLPDFIARLEQTTRWCLAHASAGPPATALKAPSLHRSVDVEGIARSVTRELVEDIADEREAQARGLPQPSPGQVRGGRLLAYDPESNLCDGAAAADSEGFLDVDNAPPPATWVCMIEEPTTPGPWRPFTRYILAWIPRVYVPLVDRGIAINPEECILWANDPQLQALGFIHRLHNAGLID